MLTQVAVVLARIRVVSRLFGVMETSEEIVDRQWNLEIPHDRGSMPSLTWTVLLKGGSAVQSKRTPTPRLMHMCERL